MAKPLLFISDLHLEEARPDITAALLSFLERHSGACEALYILGDLFEVWIGDDDESTLSANVADAFKKFGQAGSEIYLLHGNRDFLIGHDYAERCGATLIEDSTTISTPIGPAIILHGDDLCTDDAEYQKFRSLVRDELWQKDFLNKPLGERRAFAEQARQQSQLATAAKSNDIMDVNAKAVEARFQEYQQTLMIHGHTHRPAEHDITLAESIGNEKNARRVVLGDWDSQAWHIEIDTGGLRLQSQAL